MRCEICDHSNTAESLYRDGLCDVRDPQGDVVKWRKQVKSFLCTSCYRSVKLSINHERFMNPEDNV